MFKAASTEEAEQWIAAISVNAQHVGAHQHAPQLIIFSTESDAARVACTIREQRHKLLRAMSAVARSRLGDASEDMTLDVAPRFAPRRTAAEEEADLQAAAAFAETDDEEEDAVGDSAAVADGPSFEDAIALIDACDDDDSVEEILRQLPPSTAQRVLRYVRAERGHGSFTLHEENDQGYWMFIDDSDARPQGPLSSSDMRARLQAGTINASTLLRSCSIVEGLGIEHCVDETGVPAMFVPLGVLFPDPAMAESTFGAPSSWAEAYASAALFESLVSSASQLGVDRGLATHHALQMKDRDLPPDLSLLLDLCGVADIVQTASTREDRP
jgi:hypothetical protein